MSEYNKQRYYWIKLTDRFMTSDTVDFLMEQKEGANYVVLYQMLCLKTVNNDGQLSRTLGEIIVPYDEEKIQRDMKWFSIDTIRVAMSLYRKLGLIYEQENGILRISNFENMIGSQTISAHKKQLQLESRGGKKVEKIPPYKDIDIDKRDKIKKKDKDINILSNILKEYDFGFSIEEKINEWLKYKKEKNQSYKPTGFRTFLKKIEKAILEIGEQAVLDSIDNCIASNYSGVFFNKTTARKNVRASENKKQNDQFLDWCAEAYDMLEGK